MHQRPIRRAADAVAPAHTTRAGGPGNTHTAATRGRSEGWGEAPDAASELAQVDTPAADSATTPGTTPANGAAPAAAAPTLSIENQQADAATRGNTARQRVGIGEVSWITPSADGGTWSSTGGTGQVESDGVYTWTAPQTAGAFTVTYTVGTTAVPMALTVVAPATVTGTKTGDLAPAGGVHGAGMTLDLIFGPTDVSFANLGWKEEQGAIRATGIFEGRALPIVHNPAWSVIGARNDIADRAIHENFPRPWGPGLMSYDVEQWVRVGSGAATRVATVVQEHEMFDTHGASQTRKAGASSTRRTP